MEPQLIQYSAPDSERTVFQRTRRASWQFHTRSSRKFARRPSRSKLSLILRKGSPCGACSCCWSSRAFSVFATERIEGEIALSAPQCDLFVVQTDRGFSLLHEDGYYSVFEGDRIKGSLHTLGSHEVEIVGEVTLGVTVEDWYGLL